MTQESVNGSKSKSEGADYHAPPDAFGPTIQ